jgi:uncharacterized repeat protein (TIGR02543 family)
MANTLSYSIGSNNLGDITLTATIGDYINIFSYDNVYGVSNKIVVDDKAQNVVVPGCSFESVKSTIYNLKGTVTTAGTYELQIVSASYPYGKIKLEVRGITLTYDGVYFGNTSLVKLAYISVLNETITLESAGSRTNMECTGWYTAQTGGTKKGMPGDKYVFTQTDADAANDGKISFYSQWKSIVYTIEFDVRGGSAVSDISVVRGQAATLPTSTRPGYSFLGWYTDSSGGTRVGVAGELYSPKSNETLYAQWKPDIYTITFDANGGNVAPDGKAYEFDSVLGELPVPIRKGYLFDGWFTAKEGGTQIRPTDKFTTVGNIIAYAHWTQIAEFAIYNLVKDNTRFTGAYAKIGDTGIRDLPANPSKEGYGLGGFALDEGCNIFLATPNGQFYPNVIFENVQVTDSNGRIVSGAARALYTDWDLIEQEVTFDANGGEILGSNKVTTISGKIAQFPSVIRAGYELRGWSPSTDPNKIDYVTYDTVFTHKVTLYAIWGEIETTSDVLCYLERYVEGVQQKLYLPTITDIEDNITATLVEMDTVMFGYKNRFVMDTGVKQSFSVTVERVNPIDYDDEQDSNTTEEGPKSLDVSKFSNSKWWDFFIGFINFWQNNGYSRPTETETRRTGGFKFVYGPSGKDEELSELFPRIEKNVFISGQVSVHMGPGKMRFTLPLVVATMDPSATSHTWEAKFRASEGSDKTISIQTTIGLPMRFPSSDPLWDAVEANKSDPRAFSYWMKVGDTTGTKYYAGDELPYEGSYDNTPPEFYAVWESVTETRIYIIKDGVKEYPFTADKACTIHATLYGGGGTGGLGISGQHTPGSWASTDWEAGGGGGASPVTSASYYLTKGQKLIIGVGAGGGVEDKGTAEFDGKPSYIYREGYESSKIVSGIGKSGSTPSGGDINGGASGGHDRNGSRGKGSDGGQPGEKFEDNILIGGIRYYGGGGGGGSIPHMTGEDESVAYVLEGTIRLNNEEKEYKTAYIRSKGGRGANGSWATIDDIILNQRGICDAYLGKSGKGYDISGDTLTIYAGAGGGGRIRWNTLKEGENRFISPYSRGSNGVVILRITNG